MRKLLCITILSALFSSPSQIKAQDSISVKDAGEIAYRAELVINEYKDLLNIISNAQTESKETKDLIFNSYRDGKNRIFMDSAVLIANDLDPNFKDAKDAKDVTIANYLNNLDLFYSKTDTSTILFSNIRISNVKMGEYMYVKVYFTSIFTSVNTLNNKPYDSTRRVAEIKMKREGTKWVGAITNISFLASEDAIADTQNDLKIFYANNDLETTGGTDNPDFKLASTLSVEESLKEKERLRQIQAFNQEKKAYDLLIEKGDQLMASGDYASASKTFTEAQEMKPYEIYPKLKLAQIRKQVEQAALSSNELYNQFLSKAAIAENARQYEKAKEYYMNALAQKPEEAQKYKERLRDLNNKIRILSELEEKYITGLYKEAIKSYDAAIKKDNSNSDFFLGRAKCYDKLNDYSRALKDYSKSIDLDNNNLSALQYRADLYRRMNDPFKALTDYKMYLTVDKTNLAIYAEMSDLHLSTNNAKAAMEDLENALLVNPKAATIYFKKAILLQKQKSFMDATEDFTTAIRLDSSNALSYYYRAECALALNKVEQAAKDFNLARSQKLDSAWYPNIAAYASQFAEKANTFFQSKAIDSAISHISNAILIEPASDRYRFTRGMYYMEKGAFADAINNFDKAIQFNPRYEEAFYSRARAYYAQMNYETAIENFKEVTRINAINFMAFKGMGDGFYMLEKYTDAATNLETALRLIDNAKLKPGTDVMAAIYNELSSAYNKTNLYPKALDNAKAAIKLNRDFAEAYYNRGFAYYNTGDQNSAIEDLVKSLTYRNEPQWSLTLGDVYASKGDFSNAANAFAECIRYDSAGLYQQAVYRRGYAFLQLASYEAALKDYVKSVEMELDKEIKSFQNELGNIYLHSGKYDDALTAFQKAFAANNADPIALYGIASTYYLQNKLDDALTWFETLFKLRTFNIGSIKKDKLISSIRDEKRFKALVKKYD